MLVALVALGWRKAATLARACTSAVRVANRLLNRKRGSGIDRLEAHSTTGGGDLFCRIVSRSNAELEHIVQTILDIPGVVRTRTDVSLSQRVPYRVLPLLHQLTVAQLPH